MIRPQQFGSDPQCGAAPLRVVAALQPFAHVSEAVARRVSRLQISARIIGILVAILGAGYLIAWTSGYMAELGLSAITMKTNAAVGLLATATGFLLLTRRRTGRFQRQAGECLAVVAAVLGFMTLFENITGQDLRIDQLLAEEPPGAVGTTAPNRMGVPASTSFLFLGLSLLLVSRRSRRSAVISQSLALVVFLIALLVSIGHMYGAGPLHAVTRLTAIAWPTAAALLALVLGVLFARPAEGLMAQVTADDPGGIALRRLLPVLLLPVLLGWLRLAGERYGVFDAATGTALVMIVVIVALSAVAYCGSLAVSRSSAAVVDREERLRLSHEAARIGAFDWDIRNDVNVWTPELEAIHGLPPGGFQGSRQAWEDLVHPEDRVHMIEKVNSILSLAESGEGEWRVVWPDGSVHWVTGSWRVFTDAARSPLRMVGVNIEITDRKRMQDALEATIRDLERSNKELEQFAYICAHDLQEPLRHVQMYVQLLQTRHAGKLDGEAAHYFHFVLKSARRMAELIIGILEYSRAGRSETRQELTPCDKVVHEALDVLSAAIEDSRASITCDALPLVVASRTQLKQLFQNLIANAIKFRRDGIAPEIHISCRLDADRWVFSVRDNGIGIPDQYHRSLFRMFQRLHGDEKYGGTGIGLAVCKKIVQAHFGEIWIQPQNETGTTFCFALPATPRSGDAADGVNPLAQLP